MLRDQRAASMTNTSPTPRMAQRSVVENRSIDERPARSARRPRPAPSDVPADTGPRRPARSTPAASQLQPAARRQKRPAQVNQRGQQHQNDLWQQQINGFSRHASISFRCGPTCDGRLPISARLVHAGCRSIRGLHGRRGSTARASAACGSRKTRGCRPIQNMNTTSGARAAHLAQRQIAHRRLPSCEWSASLQRAEEHALHQPQHVPGPQHDAEDGQHGDHLVGQRQRLPARRSRPAGTCRSGSGTRRRSRSGPAGRCSRA